jgi:hypothetical protein
MRGLPITELQQGPVPANFFCWHLAYEVFFEKENASRISGDTA